MAPFPLQIHKIPIRNPPWMLKQLFYFSLLLLPSGFLQAQQISLLTTGRQVSLRGLSVVSDQIIWVSGSVGSVGLSTNGGINWKWMQVKGYENSDFRDIEAFSDQEAVIMGITEPAVILRTVDRGNSWHSVLEDSAKTVFLDAMDFSGDQGALVGDPYGGKIFFAVTTDRGRTWEKKIPPDFEPSAPGEAFFAASGSNICRFRDSSWALVSGGKKSSLYFAKNRFPLLMIQGEETTGANSIALHPTDPNRAFIVGGDFSHDTLRYRNSLSIRFRPFSQTIPFTPPHGYRSCVEWLDDNQMICCGTSGVDMSEDGGMHWKLISNKGFHICRKARNGRAVFLAGPNGSIAMLKIP
jgi:photosystem II stability/assembly factor-like uncharacterized protein